MNELNILIKKQKLLDGFSKSSQLYAVYKKYVLTVKLRQVERRGVEKCIIWMAENLQIQPLSILPCLDKHVALPIKGYNLIPLS